MADLTVTVTISDDAVERVLTAFATSYGYDEESKETREEFLTRQVQAFIRSTVVDREAADASTAARAAAQAAFEATAAETEAAIVLS